MQKQLVIMITCVLFLTSWCSGCEQFFSKSDSVRVNVMVAVFFTAVDENSNPVNISFNGAEVYINVLKNGISRGVFYRIVQQDICQATDNMELTKGDTIECIVTIPDGYGNFYSIANGSATLTWETAKDSMNLAGLYNWCPHITNNNEARLSKIKKTQAISQKAT